jgi:NADPH2:quinone reductase
VGVEGAGVVEEVGPGVKTVAKGDRVAYAGGAPGSYSQVRVMPVDRLVKIPKGISERQAAAMMLKGMTAQYLIRRTYAVKAGDAVLFHAAAGGVGLIACQWLKALGATVIGTVGSDEKAKLAKAHGCDHVVVYTREDFVARVKEVTNGMGVPVVYDGVGKSTFQGSLDCLRPRGLMVSYGNASGAVPPVDLLQLSSRGSLFITRPTLVHYTGTRQELEAAAKALFTVVKSGKVKIESSVTYPLAEAAKAHGDLEARKTTGSILLLP